MPEWLDTAKTSWIKICRLLLLRYNKTIMPSITGSTESHSKSLVEKDKGVLEFR